RFSAAIVWPNQSNPARRLSETSILFGRIDCISLRGCESSLPEKPDAVERFVEIWKRCGGGQTLVTSACARLIRRIQFKRRCPPLPQSRGSLIDPVAVSAGGAVESIA